MTNDPNAGKAASTASIKSYKKTISGTLLFIAAARR